MNSLELVESFSEFKELKSIDRQTMQHVLEDVFRAMLKKKFNTDEHIDVIVNIDKGDVQIFLNKEIVADGEVEDSEYGNRLFAMQLKIGDQILKSVRKFLKNSILRISDVVISFLYVKI